MESRAVAVAVALLRADEEGVDMELVKSDVADERVLDRKIEDLVAERVRAAAELGLERDEAEVRAEVKRELGLGGGQGAGAGGLDKRICACGHAAARHREEEQLSGAVEWKCRPSKTYCACREVVPVVSVPDTRSFQAKTEGEGGRHALLKGFALMSRQIARDERRKQAKREGTPIGDVVPDSLTVEEITRREKEFAEGVEWLIERGCPVCSRSEQELREAGLGPAVPFPVRVDAIGQAKISYQTEKLTGFACRDCLLEMPKAFSTSAGGVA